MPSLLYIFTLLISALFLIASPAFAYIGPGAAVAFLGYVFGPVIAIIACVALVLLWPARWFYKRMKAKKEELAQTTDTKDDQSS